MVNANVLVVEDEAIVADDITSRLEALGFGISAVTPSGDMTLQRAMAVEPYGYLRKPFRMKELQTAIEAALHRHALERKAGRSE